MNLLNPIAALLVASCFLIISNPAMAYLDPGTGSMIIQFLVAGILGGLYAIKTCWKQISAFVSKLFKKDKSDK